MYDNYSYPPGADNSSAPWNQPTVPVKDFDVTCSQTLSKTVKVNTDNYYPIFIREKDEMGGFVEQHADTSNTAWSEEYKSSGHYTPIQLIGLLKDYVTKDLIYGDSKYSKSHLEHLLKECEDWCNDETEYIEN